MIRPLADFLHTEAAGGVVLVAATIVAVVWANSPWRDSYGDVWNTHVRLGVGTHELDLSAREWVNDALMTIFFFIVGLEIKRELVEGELRDRRKASLPAIAAVGGMVVPAVLYTAINVGHAGARGWGIPMATDIAMSIGVLSILGSRIDPALKLFLLVLAIVDDIGAIVVIAVLYTDDIHLVPLLFVAAGLIAIAIMRVCGIRWVPLHLVLGIAVWLGLHESGIHATLAGVVLGLMASTRPARRADLADVAELTNVSTAEDAARTVDIARESVSVVEWLEHVLHPWTSFAIVPLFALANAGVPLGAGALGDAFHSRITYGVVTGLVLGKVVGITTFAWLAARLRLGTLPARATWRDVLAIGMIGGIGFTVSIFVSGLAFDTVARKDEAKVGILVASLLAAAAGLALAWRAGRGTRATDPRGLATTVWPEG
ncbi:MAG TPA: Na+/H+ antiporter NhaA [Acidimicrobiales bacterium]|jgi:NhaA family Na+:H+ antiporter|nr:Na+/H+ antiporter NhaA [Acidimicrobiales bacterium]